MNKKKILIGVGIVLALASSLVGAQSAIIRGEESAGSYLNLKSTSGVLQTIVNSGAITVTQVAAVDPCASAAIAKSNVPIAITTATTTSLVAISGTTTIYVCGISLTISQVVTTANIITFVTGTGATCGTATVNQTGGFGTGGVTAAAPLPVQVGYGGHTVFKSLAGDRLCATTTIGASASFAGILTYVQQ